MEDDDEVDVTLGLAPDPVLPIGVLAERLGVGVPTLRAWHGRGWLVPREVDPETGRRGYSLRDVRRGLLLVTLRRTGMETSRAARVVAESDRDAVEAHLHALAEATTLLSRLRPPRRPGLVRRVRWPEEPLVMAPVPDGEEPVAALGRLLARLAAESGRSVPEHLRVFREHGVSARPAGVPDGAMVAHDRQGVPEHLLVPWYGAPPEGTREWHWMGRRTRVCLVDDGGGLPVAHAAFDDADAAGERVLAGRYEVYDASMRCVALIQPLWPVAQVPG